jgi:hypothetical protein
MSEGLMIGTLIMVAGTAWAFTVAWLVNKYEDA